ncbi:MAG TPA: DUF5009 domain-containing protein [Candidatus Limnocylindria bacterium]|nr:DUF5009 domain-containing protein [Candidatus Limnocylindria bacterium]
MATDPKAAVAVPHTPQRILSVDALRGFVVFTMIFVNDLAGVSSKIVPPWMRHFHGKSGMTFVDLVFPAFLFIVGMSIPFALGSRLAKGEAMWKTVFHVFSRTLALLVIGIMMVNESPDASAMGWSPTLWSVLMYVSSILAFCVLGPGTKAADGRESSKIWSYATAGLRIVGSIGLALLALTFRGANGQRIISFSPFSIHTEWYGILGLIGWAYLVASLVFLCFRGNRTALLGSMVLLLGMYAAERTGAFNDFWLARYVGLGGALGSQASITVAGVLLASILRDPTMTSAGPRVRFTLLFAAGCAAGALLLHGLYGINKNSATPSWCLWASAITALLWLGFYALCDVRSPGRVAKALALAGSNVLLAYLLSEMFPSLLDLVGAGDLYGHLAHGGLASAIARSAGCGVIILLAAMGLNRAGFRLKI